MPLSPYTFVRRSPPGAAALAPIGGMGETRKISWIIRMTSRRIAQIRNSPEGSITLSPRCLFQELFANNQPVAVIAYMLAIGSPPFAEDSIYEAFPNEYDPAFHSFTQDFSTQQITPIILIGDSGEPEHQLAMKNIMASFLVPAVGRIAQMDPWTVPQFEACLQSMLDEFPSRLALWEAAGR